MTDTLADRMKPTYEVSAIEDGVVVGIYVGPIKRAASWARRANPSAALRARKDG